MPRRAPRRAMRQSQAIASSRAPPKAAPLRRRSPAPGSAGDRPAPRCPGGARRPAATSTSSSAVRSPRSRPDEKWRSPSPASSTTRAAADRGGREVGSRARRGSRRRGRWRGPRWRSARSGWPSPSSTRRRPDGGFSAGISSRHGGGSGRDSYYGALLARDGHDVTLVARGAAPRRAARPAGLIVVREADGTRWEAPVRALAEPAGPAPDLVIVTTKSHHTLAAARAIAPVVGPTARRCSRCRTASRTSDAHRAVGARRRAGARGHRLRRPPRGRARHRGPRGRGAGEDRRPGRPHRARDAGSTRCSRRRGTSTLSDRIVHDQWLKLLWNAGFNAICAVTGATAGEALATPGSEALVREAMWEVVAVAARHGVTLDAEDVDEMAATKPELRDYHPSTARDLEAGKPLERDALCGFLAREGARARRADARQPGARRPARPPGGPRPRRGGEPFHRTGKGPVKRPGDRRTRDLACPLGHAIDGGVTTMRITELVARRDGGAGRRLGGVVVADQATTAGATPRRSR